MDFKIKGWISRKGLIITGIVLVVGVAGFAGYAIYQNMSANAGYLSTLGRSATTNGVFYQGTNLYSIDKKQWLGTMTFKSSTGVAVTPDVNAPANWSPNGKKLILASNSTSKLYVSDADGSNTVIVSGYVSYSKITFINQDRFITKTTTGRTLFNANGTVIGTIPETATLSDNIPVKIDTYIEQFTDPLVTSPDGKSFAAVAIKNGTNGGDASTFVNLSGIAIYTLNADQTNFELTSFKPWLELGVIGGWKAGDTAYEKMDWTIGKIVGWSANNKMFVKLTKQGMAAGPRISTQIIALNVDSARTITTTQATVQVLSTGDEGQQSGSGFYVPTLLSPNGLYIAFPNRSSTTLAEKLFDQIKIIDTSTGATYATISGTGTVYFDLMFSPTSNQIAYLPRVFSSVYNSYVQGNAVYTMSTKTSATFPSLGHGPIDFGAFGQSGQQWQGLQATSTTPTAIVASAKTATTVSLSFVTAVEKDPLGYTIERSTQPNATYVAGQYSSRKWTVKTIAASKLITTDTGLAHNTAYYYRVYKASTVNFANGNIAVTPIIKVTTAP